MKEVHEYEKDLASIRDVMERSAKFISLSGLSGRAGRNICLNWCRGGLFCGTIPRFAA